MKLSSSHLAWDCYHEFIYTGINSFALFITIVAWGCMWESQRGVWGESIRVRGLSGGGHKEKKERKWAQTVKLLPISSPATVTYRKSNRVNERSGANQIPYLNHPGNIQQLIKYPVLRPQFHILSCTGAGTSNYNERCHHCKRLITNVSLRKMRGLQDFHSYLYPRLYLWHLRSSLFISVSHTLIHTVHLWTHTQHVS